MILRKILLGDGAGEYLPFALARLRALERVSPKGFLSQKFQVDSAQIEVEHTKHIQTVRITMSGFYFEFFTTGHPIERVPYSQGGVPGTKYKAAVVGVTVSLQGGTLTASPSLLGGKRVEDTSTVSRIKRHAQVDLLDEPVAYQGGKFNKALYESFAPVSPYSGTYTSAFFPAYASYEYSPNVPPLVAHNSRDTGYDIPWEYGSKARPVVDAYLTDPTDWPRASGLLTSAAGVTYAVSVDAFDQVSVFPISEIAPEVLAGDAITQNVDPKYVQTLRIPLPTWVYAKSQTFKSYYEATTDLGLAAFPELDWKIHPDGTKLCAVVFERVATTFDTGYYAPYATDTGTQGPDTYFPRPASFVRQGQAFAGAARLSDVAVDDTAARYFTATGLIEVALLVETTGSSPEDFIITLNTTEVRRPTTSAYCTFLAGYPWSNIPSKDGKTFDAKKGDLVVLDIERYGRESDGWTVSFFSLKNLTQDQEIRTFGGSTEGANTRAIERVTGQLCVEPPVLLAADMTTLSFALKRQHRVDTDFVGDPQLDGTYRATHHFCVSIYTLNRYRDSLFPDLLPDDLKTFFQTTADIDVREDAFQALGPMILVQLNVNRDWTDPQLQSLRETYAWSDVYRDFTYFDGAHQLPPFDPTWDGATQFVGMQNKGYKIWRNGGRTTPVTTQNTFNWYDPVMRAIDPPWLMFDCVAPMPTWQLYAGLITQRLGMTSNTTFFAHPNGTWAFYDQQFFYNKNGMNFRTYFLADNTLVDLQPENIEHCVFDKVHFSLSPASKDTTFLALYNQAVGDTPRDDGTAQIVAASRKATVTVFSSAGDGMPDVQIGFVQADWFHTQPFVYKEDAYFSGNRTPYILAGTATDTPPIGGMQSLSFGGPWYLGLERVDPVVPIAEAKPYKFSSCTLIMP